MTGFRNKFQFCRKRPLNEQCWENQWIQYSHLPAVLALTQTSKNLKVNYFWAPCGGSEYLISEEFPGTISVSHEFKGGPPRPWKPLFRLLSDTFLRIAV